LIGKKKKKKKKERNGIDQWIIIGNEWKIKSNILYMKKKGKKNYLIIT